MTASFNQLSKLQLRMLSKEEEIRTDGVEVRREDQDKINKFSRLHQRVMSLEDELKLKLQIWRVQQKDKEEYEDVSNELELADEDDKILYRIGDSFVSLPVPQVQELLAESTSKIEEDLTQLEERLYAIKREMSELKVTLYARFGRSINLET